MLSQTSRPLTLLLSGIGLGALAVGGALSQPSSAARSVDYERDVQPIFRARCVACHGPNLQRNGLRLDTAARALAGGDSGNAVVPLKSSESDLLARVVSRDPKKVMPPAGPSLSAEQVATLRIWIDQGAKSPAAAADAGPKSAHWSFQSVVRPKVPKVKDAKWVRNPIDAFILQRLERQGLRPSPEAGRVTLIRRLSLDLAGLPPSVEEVNAYLADRSPSAYERLVDRLLASPHYGEKWGRHWLDLARYADSNGYTIDSARSIWKYRDWVIEALNADMPFDDFTVEQLAGDMLARSSGVVEHGIDGSGVPISNTPPLQHSNTPLNPVIATGFHRNTLINEEGGTDKEQFRVEAVKDRVDTTGSVWLGLTVGCAQCHTHKYDPITQREYYQFYAFLNSADEPALPLPTPEQRKEQEALESRIAAARKELKAHDENLAAHQAAWEERARSQGELAWNVLDPLEARSSENTRLEKQADRSLLVSSRVPEDDVYTVTVDAPREPVTAIGLEALTHSTLPSNGPGLGGGGNFILTGFSLALQAPGAPSPAPVALAGAVADHAQPGYPVTHALDESPKTGWAINTGKDQPVRMNGDHRAAFLLKEPLAAPAGARLVITLRHENANKRYQLGRFRLSTSTAPRERFAFLLADEARALLAVRPAQRTKEQAERIAYEFRRTDTGRERLTTQIARLEEAEKDLQKKVVTTLVMRELPQPRETHVQIRGDFLRKGPRVQPNVPAVLPPLPATVKNPTRLDLARWLVDPKNPLTPRVTVNRVWQRYFGLGLVETENDFGTQGARPTHPELLDWLASAFVSGGVLEGEYGSVEVGKYGSGSQSDRSDHPHTPTPPHPHTPTLPYSHTVRPWSLKSLHRLIVTSATYRQASSGRADLERADPRNRLLGRQNRLRLEAEGVRDAALAASGLLSRKIGGPSVFPPQPAGLDVFTQTKKNWVPSQGEDRYRRGMYTFFWRSSPDPFLTTFDAPNGNVTCTRRNRSNTPLGALMLANDPSLVEMAQGLAARVLQAPATSDEERVRYAFRRCLSREPAAAEAARLLEYYRAQLAGFQAAPAEAAKVAAKERAAGEDAATAAAWTALARVLLNVDEFITRE